ncbi:sulfur carrier protein ThiS [Roseobacter sp. HKCCD9010]|uniref:sulfur carrier protein ThiS n=1 Tax=unclassified Roseobacter TaxID=196798 RepID=UPI00149242F3|nr:MULTISPECIES: sulfur carrier protein ThiS [unclassified Roseobacter]MBF9052533.1 sulfur carrier protein ThiS [Rhodobacterales bacterium HKCCD4356]NNV14468.1 sulfur carrier protein ThiS [Roseobacter sp. HKCCD7357]NNV18734.1 sulfur carrier protein ThiS [Roseobacter sp. HKCCD8768]NNV28178.1 sulfur carrier protein ThiS [Roseobacter sp. HKCCD8192]NNV32462.1 sulfur carrier protein ThiS [Roseobacter sp. HKCCD9061]
MKIVVNGETVDAEGQTLMDLLEQLGQARAKVATAVNAAFVPAARRASTILSEGDAVEIVAPRQGG